MRDNKSILLALLAAGLVITWGYHLYDKSQYSNQTREEGDKSFTSKLTVPYEQGKRQNVQLPLVQDKFQTGDYKIQVYHNGFKIGEGVRTLKKGGLFS